MQGDRDALIMESNEKLYNVYFSLLAQLPNDEMFIMCCNSEI